MPTAPKQFRPPGRPQNEKEIKRAYDREHEEDRSFYWSTPWRKFRAWFLGQHPLCEWCQAEGRYESATEVDHRIPRRDRPDLAFDENNCRAGCKPCHARYGAKSKRAR